MNFFNSSLVDVDQETVASVAPTIEVAREAESGAGLADERQATWVSCCGIRHGTTR